MEDMAANEPIDPNLQVTFTHEGEAMTYDLVASSTNMAGFVHASNTSQHTTSGSLTGGTYYPGVQTYPGVVPTVSGLVFDEADLPLEITHITEEEEGMVGWTNDGQRILLGEFVPTVVSLRIRTLLERIAAGEDFEDSDLEKFAKF